MNKGGSLEQEIRFLLRSPRSTLGGYCFLPRLIDKVRLQEKGALPPQYHENLLKPGRTFDGRLMEFIGVAPEDLRRIILESRNDEEVLERVIKVGLKKTGQEKKDWIESIRKDRPVPERASARKIHYPEVAIKYDVSGLSPFDLVDLDEVRISTPQD